MDVRSGGFASGIPRDSAGAVRIPTESLLRQLPQGLIGRQRNFDQAVLSVLHLGCQCSLGGQSWLLELMAPKLRVAAGDGIGL